MDVCIVIHTAANQSRSTFDRSIADVPSSGNPQCVAESHSLSGRASGAKKLCLARAELTSNPHAGECPTAVCTRIRPLAPSVCTSHTRSATFTVCVPAPRYHSLAHSTHRSTFSFACVRIRPRPPRRCTVIPTVNTWEPLPLALTELLMAPTLRKNTLSFQSGRDRSPTSYRKYPSYDQNDLLLISRYQVRVWFG